ncbi:hypothetical protein GCM10008904_00390 [Paraclostridium ghonii]
MSFIIASFAFKYIISKKYFNKYRNPNRYINLSFYLIFVSGISYVVMGIPSLYVNGIIFLGIICLIPLIILKLSSKIDDKFGIKNTQS